MLLPLTDNRAVVESSEIILDTVLPPGSSSITLVVHASGKVHDLGDKKRAV